MTNKIKATIFIFAILAIVVLISALGKDMTAGLSVDISEDNIISYDGSLKKSAIIDNYGKRLILMDGDGKATSIEAKHFLSTKYSEFKDCAVAGDNTYVLNLEYEGYTNFVAREYVTAYDKDNKKLGTVFEYVYPGDNKYAHNTRILGIKSIEDNKAIIARYDRATKTISLDILSSTGSTHFCDLPTKSFYPRRFDYDRDVNKVVISDYNANVYLLSLDGSEELLPSDGYVIGEVKMYHNSIWGFNLLDKKPYYCNFASDRKWHSFLLEDMGKYLEADASMFQNTLEMDYNTGQLYRIDTTGTVHFFNTVPYTKGYTAYTLAIWLSLLYLLLLLLWYIYRHSSLSDMARFVEVILIPVVCIAITGYFAYANFNNTKTDLTAKLQANTLSLVDMQRISQGNFRHPYLGDILARVDAKNGTPWEVVRAIHSNRSPYDNMTASDIQIGNEYELVSRYFGKYSSHSSKANQADEVRLYYKDKDGKWRLYIDSVFTEVPGQEFVYTDQLASTGPDGKTFFADWIEGGSYANYLHYIQDEGGENVGLIIMATRMEMLTFKHLHNWLTMIITLLMAGITLYFLYTSINGAARSSSRYKRFIAEGREHVELAWYQQFTMLSTIMMGADGFIMVLIAKDILEAGGSYAVELLSVPFVAMSVGAFISGSVLAYLIHRLPFGRIMLIGAVGFSVCAVLTFIAVQANNFWGFTAGKFLMSLFSSVLNSACYTMPLQFTNERDRSEGNQGMALTKISATAIGAAFCGYISEYIGNSYIYIMLILPALLFSFMSIKFIPGKMFYGESKADGGTNVKLKDMFSITIRPPMLALFIAIILPFEIFTNYGKFLFPLIGSGADLTKADINNIIVITNALVFVLRDVLKNATKNLDYWKGLISGMVMFSLVYLCFIVNESILWAVVALLAISALDRVVSPMYAVMWQRYTMEHKIPIIEYNNFYVYVNNILRMFPVPVCSFLIGFGITACCSAFFAIGTAGAAGFAAISRNSSMNKPPAA